MLLLTNHDLQAKAEIDATLSDREKIVRTRKARKHDHESERLAWIKYAQTEKAFAESTYEVEKRELDSLVNDLKAYTYKYTRAFVLTKFRTHV